MHIKKRITPWTQAQEGRVCLLYTSIVNIASSSLGTVLFTKLLGAQMGPLVSTIVMTVVVLAFGEVTPKSYAKANSDRLVLSNGKILTCLLYTSRCV